MAAVAALGIGAYKYLSEEKVALTPTIADQILEMARKKKEEQETIKVGPEDYDVLDKDGNVIYKGGGGSQNNNDDNGEEKPAPVEPRPESGGSSSENVSEKSIFDLSNKAVKHPMNDHMPIRYAQQLEHISRETAEKYLEYNTFFNPNWTDAQVRAALNYGYKEAINNGFLTGHYSFKYLGETVTIYMENGIFKTGYGNYIFKYEELLKLLPGGM